ncbi:MAG: hypothetical protein J0L73_11445 [Verrucomicrobia bacterium]|nr:hypothetical protein [Verrucomicrobiota bacterium]
MNLHRKLPYVPQLLAGLCLLVAIISGLQDPISSVKVHPWYRCQHDLFSVILSAVAAGAYSKTVRFMGLISFGVFAFLLLQEYLVLLRMGKP